MNFIDSDGNAPYNPKDFYGNNSAFSNDFDPNTTIYGNGSFGGYKYFEMGLNYDGGGGSAATFGETQMYKDIMAYLADGGSSLSPWMQANINGEYQPLNKSTLLNYVSQLYPGLSAGALQQKAGSLFENAFNTIMGIDYSSLNYESNDLKIAGMYKNRARNTIPDGVFDLVRDNYYSVEVGRLRIPTPFPKNSIRYSGAQFAEVKAMDGTLYSSSNTGQISSMIYSMSRNNGVKDYGGQFIIGTTADTIISPRIIAEGAAYGIQVIQMTAQYRMVSGAMKVRFYYGGPSPSSAFIR